MNFEFRPTHKALGWLAGFAAVTILLGCSSTGINWDKRVGIYSWDDALTDFGRPTRVTDEAGGVKTAEWIQERGPGVVYGSGLPAYTRGETIDPLQTYGTTAPPKILKLSFTPAGKLLDWDRNY